MELLSLPKKIKVLHLTTDSRIAGAEKLLLGIADNYRRDKYQLYFCTIKGEGDFHRELNQRHQKTLSLNCHNIYQAFRGIWRLVNILRQERMDILHTHLYHAAILGGIAARISRVPTLIMTRHYSDLIYLYGSYLERLLDRLASRITHHIIAISRGVKRVLVNLDHINPDKITVIYNGIDISDWQPGSEHNTRDLKRELGIDDSAKIVGAVSTLHPRKGHRYLIEAAKDVCSRKPNVRFLIVGDGQLKGQLQQLAFRLNLGRHVIFTGYRKDISKLISIMDILVQPSVEEGFGITLLEAMAAGKPVIGTEVGGIPEIIKGGVNGLLVPPRDPSSLSRAIQKLLNNPEQAKYMGQRGRQMLEKHFTISKMVKKYEELYERLNRNSLNL